MPPPPPPLECALAPDSTGLAAPQESVLATFRYVHAVQNPPRSDACSSRLRRVGPSWHGMGFAASMQMMAHEFMNAASAVAQQPVAALSTQGWAYGCSESGGDWACFEPLSPCGEAERAAAPPAAFEGGPGDALPAGAPSPPANLNGPRWWALMQAYVFTLSAEQRARIRCLHAALGLTFPCADGERRRGQLAARLGAPLDAAAEARAAAHAPCVAAADDAAASLFPRDAGCLSVGMHVRLGDRRVQQRILLRRERVRAQPRSEVVVVALAALLADAAFEAARDLRPSHARLHELDKLLILRRRPCAALLQLGRRHLRSIDSQATEERVSYGRRGIPASSKY